MSDRVEVKLPYFMDIYRMHWLAQPFAVLANFVLSVIYLTVIVVGWIAFAAIAIVAFVFAIPFILWSDIFSWICGMFKYRHH